MDQDRARTRAIDDALKSACEGCGIEEGDILSDEQVSNFARGISKRLEPFLIQTILGSRFTEEELAGIKRMSRVGKP